MPKPKVLISIDTLEPTVPGNIGRKFIEALCNEDNRLIPQQLSISESFKDPFLGVDNFVEKWWAMPFKAYMDGKFDWEGFRGPHWRRRSTVKGQGFVKHGLVNIKGEQIESSLWFECDWHKQINFTNLFEKWAVITKPTIAMLHIFVEEERNRPQTQDLMSFEVGSFGGPMDPGIPNMGWAMAFGEQNTKNLDVKRIKEKGFYVDQLDWGVIIRVTENLSDVVNDFAYFSERRQLLKTLFPTGMFKTMDEPTFN